jgi:hypothetical protein
MLSPPVLKQDPSSLQSLGNGYIPHSPRDSAPASRARRGPGTPNRNVSDHHRSLGNLHNKMFSVPRSVCTTLKPCCLLMVSKMFHFCYGGGAYVPKCQRISKISLLCMRRWNTIYFETDDPLAHPTFAEEIRSLPTSGRNVGHLVSDTKVSYTFPLINFDGTTVLANDGKVRDISPLFSSI